MLSRQMSANAWGVHEQLCAIQDRGGGSQEDSRRIQGGEAGGADGVEEETSARRAGLALHWREQKEERKSLRHSSFLSTHLSVSAFSSPAFSHHIWTHSIHFFPPFQHSFCFLSRLHTSSRPSSFSFIPFIVVYLSSAPSFHFCLFVCVLTIFSQGKSLARDLCQCSLDCATLPREWVSNTDTGTACWGDGTTLKPMAPEQHEYMSAATHSSRA